MNVILLNQTFPNFLMLYFSHGSAESISKSIYIFPTSLADALSKHFYISAAGPADPIIKAFLL